MLITLRLFLIYLGKPGEHVHQQCTFIPWKNPLVSRLVHAVNALFENSEENT